MSRVFVPRSLISSSNSETMMLKSSFPETRLTFLNAGTGAPNYQITVNPAIQNRNMIVQTIPGNGAPSFTISSSNTLFNFIQDTNVMASFETVNNIPNYTVFGSTRSSNFSIIPGADGKKNIILKDYNRTSEHQYGGFGYTAGILNYQVPVRNAIHAFYAASSANNSVEWMRLQEDISGNAQLGIGTSILRSNVALQVAGNVTIDGTLNIKNGITGFLFDTSQFVKYNSNSTRISSNALPEKVPLLNNNNKIDVSLLPTEYNFQYLKSNKNVGIGTKFPQQKFHVEGSTVISQRLGIGTTNPLARLHIEENSATIPNIILKNKSGGDILHSYIGNGTPAIFMSGARPSLAIGTSNILPGNALTVEGNVLINGDISFCNINLRYVNAENINITNPTYGPVFKLETVVASDGSRQIAIRCTAPLQCYGNVTTDYISSTQTYGTVRIYNSSLQVDNDLLLSFAPTIASDKRLKTDIYKIENALDKIDKIHGYRFRYTQNGQKSAGVIAQEINEVLPEAVKLCKNGYYGVQYDAIISLLIEAIHELKDKIK